MSSITGLNHLTLSVSDLDRSVAFYSGPLGFSLRMRGPSSAYLESGALWLALVLDPEARPGPLAEYSHIALAVAPADLPLLSDRLTLAGVTRWQGPDHSDSLYFLDPDGHKLELHTGDLQQRLAAREALREPGVMPCDWHRMSRPLKRFGKRPRNPHPTTCSPSEASIVDPSPRPTGAKGQRSIPPRISPFCGRIKHC